MSATIQATLKISRGLEEFQAPNVTVVAHCELVRVEMELDWSVIDQAFSLQTVVTRHLDAPDVDGTISCIDAHIARCNCCGESVTETDAGYECGCVAETWTDADRWREAS